ncbi:VC0807 family protein [Nocardioides dongkuii]|uniref:VC0807 family protein n=1 Tax=Nocardioides dongkuii TaxID=2760089 RepID=UPI0015FBB3E9|nr:VC0807 family protein [Nocardioides dongkuii]
MSSLSAPPRPRLLTIVRRTAASLLVACVVPAVLFCTVMLTLGVWPAIIAALAWSYGAIGWRAVTGRRASGLLILTAVVMTGRTVVALLADSTYLYFLQPIISDGVVAGAFLLSLATARPLVARLAGDFYPMDRELHLRPPIRRLFWRLTVMWAVLCLGKAGMALWMLESTMPVETFVVIRDAALLALNVLAVGATIAYAARVARSEGLLAHA